MYVHIAICLQRIRSVHTQLQTCKRQTMRNVKPQFTSLPRGSIPARYSRLHYSALNPWLHNRLLSSTAVPHSSSRGEERSGNSVVFLQNIFERAVHRAEVKQEPTRRIFERQRSLDDEWSRQLRLLYKNMDVSSAVLACNKLPSNRSKQGFDILINVLVEKGGEYGTDLRLHGEISDKSFELLQQMKAKGFAPSEITCRKLLKSIFDKGDMVRFKKILHWVNEQEILGPHTTKDIPQEENPQVQTTDNAEYNNIVGNIGKLKIKSLCQTDL